MDESSASPGRRRQRGVRLTDLDRERLWVIGHTGRRWETLGPLDELYGPVSDLVHIPPQDLEHSDAWLAPDAGAGGGAPSTAPEPGAPGTDVA